MAYEAEKEQAKLDFVQRFVWNNADGVALKARDESEAAKCEYREDCSQAGTVRLFDYEDDVSGGLPVCPEHMAEHVFEAGPTQESWVTQYPNGAWEGVGTAKGQGWKHCWMIFAPEGRYSRWLETPHRKEDGTWSKGALNPAWPAE